MRRTAAIALAAALTATVGLVAATPAHAIPPPPNLLCANDFSTTNLTGWSRSGGAWAVTGGVYRQSSTSAPNAHSWYQEEFFSHEAKAKLKLVSAPRPTSFVAFTIAVRGANTSYRLVLQARSVAQLQFVDNGVVTVLASQAQPVAVGTTYAVQMGIMSTSVYGMVGGLMLFGGAVPVPTGGHFIGGVGFATGRAAATFDDLSVTIFGPLDVPPCPTTP